jgi:hypothetical protein
MLSTLPFLRMRSRPVVHLGTRLILPLLRLPYHLKDPQLSSHFHVMGTTGVGKSKLLASFAAQLILQGRACSVVDPHADLAHDVLRLLLDAGYFRRPSAQKRVLYIDFADRARYVPFNVLRQPYPVDVVARNLVEACMRAWPALADGQAPQFENILLASAVTLTENRLPVTQMTRLLTDRTYRERLLRQVTDHEVVAFFTNRFDQWGRETPQMIESTLRRVFLLSFSPALRFSLGQAENLLEFRRLMDSQTSLILNLGGLDEQTQRLLGSLVTVGFETAALSRADLPERERLPYHLVMDEFSMFSAQSEEALARVLSLARKYRLFLTLAHQTWSQLSERLQGALQNATPIYFRLGFDDATWAAPRLFAHDPYKVKHEVRPLGGAELGMEHHPVYFQLQEQLEGRVRRIENLWPQQAYVKVNRAVPRLLRRWFTRTKTLKIQTRTLPPARSRPEEIAALKSAYAAQLLTPRLRLEARSDKRERTDTANALGATVAKRSIQRVAPLPPLLKSADSSARTPARTTVVAAAHSGPALGSALRRGASHGFISPPSAG